MDLEEAQLGKRVSFRKKHQQISAWCVNLNNLFYKSFFLSWFKATGEVMFTDLMSPYISVCFSVPAALSLAHGILIVNLFLQKYTLLISEYIFLTF